MGYRKTKDVLAMANLLLNTRPDASSAEVMRKAASMLRDIAEERAHLTQPAQAVDVGTVLQVIAEMRGFRNTRPPNWNHLDAFADKLTAALPNANGKEDNDAAR